MILVRLDLSESPMLEGSTRLPVYWFPEFLKSQTGGPGERGLGSVESRETSIRERFRDTAELGFHMDLSRRSAQRRSEDVQRTLRSAQRSLRGLAENVQRTRRSAQRTLTGR